MFAFLQRLFSRPLPPPPPPPTAAGGIPVYEVGQAPPVLVWPGALDVLRPMLALAAHNAPAWAPIIAEACARHGITRRLRLAAFLANCSHETLQFARLEEALSYSAERIVAVWPSRFPSTTAARPYERNPERLANRVYANRMGNGDEASGDGWLWRGRGLLQTTGRDNYRRLAVAAMRPMEDLPAWLLTREGAAESAAAYWEWARCNEPADRGDIAEVRRRINGGTLGLADVRDHYARALAALDVGDQS